MIEIRAAKIADLQTLQDLDHAHFVYSEKFTNIGNIKWPYTNFGHDYYSKRINESNGIALLAFDDSTPIGYIVGSVEQNEMYTTTPMAEIDALFVQDGYRSKGVGKLLITAFREQAKHKGAKSIKLLTHYKNLDAIKFYKSHGFQDYGIVLLEIL